MFSEDRLSYILAGTLSAFIGFALGISAATNRLEKKYTFKCPDTPVMTVYFKETGEFRCVYNESAVSSTNHYAAPYKKSLEKK